MIQATTTLTRAALSFVADGSIEALDVGDTPGRSGGQRIGHAS